jgi:HEAT repeat protein
MHPGTRRSRKRTSSGSERLETKLSALFGLREAGAAARVAGLQHALHDRSNYLVAKAAELAAEGGHDELIPDLLAVYGELFGDDAVERDQLVRAKEAIARALRTLGYRRPEPFVRGLHHVQFEPTWGAPRGVEDHAGSLRCACAHALVDTDLLAGAALRELIPHLTDPIARVRVDTVRAVSQIGGDDAVLLLRLKAHAGDEEPEVIGECFAAILDREPGAAVAFIVPFLQHERDAIKVEAAATLALDRDPAALDHLRAFLNEELSGDVRTATIAACAASPQRAVADLLLEIAGGHNRSSARSALQALSESRFRNDVRERARSAVQRSGDQQLMAAFTSAFGHE